MRWTAVHLLAAIALVCVLGACGGGGDDAPAQRPNVLLISIDSLRADHVGCYGYAKPTTPTIDRLAREGVMFRSAVSTTSWTLPAHAAMFTGLYDSAHGATDVTARLDERHVTLAEAMRDAGYQTVGLYGGPFLHPTFGLDQGFETYINCMSVLPSDAPAEAFREYASHAASHDDVTGPRTAEQFAAWLESQAAADGRPMFAFIHLWDVHFDYIPPEKYVRMFDADYQGDVTARNFMNNDAVHPGMDARDLAHVLALYDGEIRFTDDIIAQLLDALREAGRLDNTLVVITSDHGEEFFEHGGKGHQRTLFDEVVRVPLVVWWPGRVEAGGVVEQQVRLIDIAPTLLAAAGAAVPQAMQGRDLRPVMDGAGVTDEAALLELLGFGERVCGVRTNDYELLRDEQRELVGFFDLHKDPREQRSVSGDARARTAAEQLRALVAANEALRMADEEGAGNDATMDDAMRRRLESLGYTGD